MIKTFRYFVALISVIAVASCSGSDSETVPEEQKFVSDIRAAVQAVETELGGPQQYFEVTATPQLTNVFVAVDDASTATPYVFFDGELETPAPNITGAQGQTFGADAIDFDENTVLSGVADGLPNATIDSFSVEGGPDGFVRYVVSARSEVGGILDIVVAPSGAIIEVDPL